jgi:hypothetical protein
MEGKKMKSLETLTNELLEADAQIKRHKLKKRGVVAAILSITPLGQDVAHAGPYTLTFVRNQNKMTKIKVEDKE